MDEGAARTVEALFERFFPADARRDRTGGPLRRMSTGCTLSRHETEWVARQLVCPSGAHASKSRRVAVMDDYVGVLHPSVRVDYADLCVIATAKKASEVNPSVLGSLFQTLTLSPLRVAVNKRATAKRRKEVLRGVTGALEPGRMTLLLGPPGAGKSVLLRAIAGRLHRSATLRVEGTVSYDGETDLPEACSRRLVGLVDQQDLHIAEQSVLQIVAFASECLRDRNQEALAVQVLLRIERKLAERPDAGLANKAENGMLEPAAGFEATLLAESSGATGAAASAPVAPPAAAAAAAASAAGKGARPLSIGSRPGEIRDSGVFSTRLQLLARAAQRAARRFAGGRRPSGVAGVDKVDGVADPELGGSPSALDSEVSSESLGIKPSPSLEEDASLKDSPVSSRDLSQSPSATADAELSDLDFVRLLLVAHAARVEPFEALESMGLSRVADTSIGSTLVRGVSGGERRRTSVAEVLVGPHAVVLGDEFSTGMDSATTYGIVKHLGEATRALKKTTLLVLLQPAPEVVELFDDLVLLADGRVLYHGPTDRALDFFAERGFACPPRKDPGAFLLELTTPAGQYAYATTSLFDAHAVPAARRSPASILADPPRRLLVPMAELSSAFWEDERWGQPMERAVAERAAQAARARSSRWRVLFNALTAKPKSGGGPGQIRGGPRRITAAAERSLPVARTCMDPGARRSSAAELGAAAPHGVSAAELGAAASHGVSAAELGAAAPHDASAPSLGLCAGPRPGISTLMGKTAGGGDLETRRSPRAPPTPSSRGWSALGPTGPHGAAGTLPTPLPRLHLLKLVIARQLNLTYVRGLPFRVIRVGQAILISVIVSTLFINMTPSTESWRSFVAVVVVITVTSLTNNLPSLAQVHLLRPVLVRQRDAGLCPAWMHSVAAALTGLPSSFVESGIMCIFVYWMTGFYRTADRFFIFFAVMFALDNASASLFRFVGYVAPSLTVGSAVATLIISVLMALNGFSLILARIPKYAIWAYYSSPVSWAVRALTINELTSSQWDVSIAGSAATMPLGQIALDGFGMGSDRAFVFSSIGVIWGLCLVYILVGCLGVSCVRARNLQATLDEAELRGRERRGVVARVWRALRLGPAERGGKEKEEEEDTEEEAEVDGEARGAGEASLRTKAPEGSWKHGEGREARSPGGLGDSTEERSAQAADEEDEEDVELQRAALTSVAQHARIPHGRAVQIALSFEEAAVAPAPNAARWATGGRGDDADAAEPGSPGASASPPEADGRVSRWPEDVVSGRRLGSPRPPSPGASDSCPRITLVCEDLCYCVSRPTRRLSLGGATAGADRLQLLRGVSFFAQPGELVALMGGSGAGKTTLMDVVCGRKTVGAVTGEILVNGHPKAQETWSRVVGYVEQNDIHSSRVTVLESLLFSARLRLPPSASRAEVERTVASTLAMVELDGLAGRIVGEAGESGLTDQQRKRLSIAVELVANPSVVFMDEPTSGLDARAAAIVMRAVRNVADSDRTVMVTIHQPSIELFETFDTMVLMHRGGRLAYFGELGFESSKLVEYLEGYGVERLRPGHNPATWMLEVTGGAASTTFRATDLDFPQLYLESELYARNRAEGERLARRLAASRGPLTGHGRERASFWTQSRCILRRYNRIYWHSPEYVLVRNVLSFATALIVGVIYLRQGRVPDQGILTFGEPQAIAGMTYAIAVFLGMVNLFSIQPLMQDERLVFYRERAAGYYSSGPYSLAIALVELPWLVLQSFVVSIPLYLLVGFERLWWKFWYYELVMFLTLTLYTFFGQLAVLLTPSPETTQLACVIFNQVFSIFNGFVLPYPQIPTGWRWMNRFVPTTYVMWGITASQLGDRTTLMIDTALQIVEVRDYVRDYFGWRFDFIWWCPLILAGYCVFFRIASVAALKYVSFLKR